MRIKRLFATCVIGMILSSYILPFISLKHSEPINNEIIDSVIIEEVQKEEMYEAESLEISFPSYEIQAIDICEIAENEYLELLNNKDSYEDIYTWFLDYKTLIENYQDYLDIPETIYDYFTEEEINLICRCIETECHGGDFESKTHVASVILNRVDHESFPDTATDVVTAANQFSYIRKNYTDDTLLALEYAFEIEDTTDGCLFFHSNGMTSKFNGADYQFTDSVGHHFYK